MEGRILEIESAGRTLRLYRGFCIIEENSNELGRIALDDLECVIYHSHNGIITQHLLAELAERGIPLVVCNTKHMPVGIFWSLSFHHQATKRIQLFADLSGPRKKLAWQQIVRCKIKNQFHVLDSLGNPRKELLRLAKAVRSGDPENCEAQAAQIYWRYLFDNSFRRNPEGEFPNNFLNYGYAVLRASVTRHLIGCGLHPGLGLHHHNALDPTPLANDMMEPWRPVIDIAVRKLWQRGKRDLGPQEKSVLAGALDWDLESPLGKSPLRLCIQRMCYSLFEFCSGATNTLLIADLPGKNEIREEFEGECVL